MSGYWYPPGKALQPVKERKERFRDMVAFVADRGWVVSTPGAAEVTIECLPTSTLPDELAAAGHRIEEIEAGERILPTAITEAVITEGSTVPIMVRHAGIVRVRRYSFPI